jgi:deoxyribodipyrimidine photo-lyase
VPQYQRALCWIRRDLRISDHAALAAATQSSAQVAVVFVFDRKILDELKDRDDRRLTFIYRSLQEVDARLREHGSRLVVLHGDPVVEIPKLAAHMKAEAVFTARDYEPYARERDAAVASEVNLVTVKDIVVREGGEIFSGSGTPMRVYTPYSKVWRSLFHLSDAEEKRADFGHLWPIDSLGPDQPWPLAQFGFQESELWLVPGESGGQAELEKFRAKVNGYGANRDFPAVDGVSHLSVHLRFGTVSVRSAVRFALEANTAGSDKWLAELIWREFYQDILFHHPKAVSEPFQPQYQDLEYPGPVEMGLEPAFQAWCTGQTGYPLVDAAMRCLNATGYMHNRLRMVVASFLTKDLLIDYRWGEAYFARLLLDFDLASNNGGWQWSASVGADPQPYFRIFNPILQSRKFDPDGTFIRRWVPELAELDANAIHFPSEKTPMELLAQGVELGSTYPYPVVDHAVMRDRAVKLLEAAAKGKS